MSSIFRLSLINNKIIMTNKLMLESQLENTSKIKTKHNSIIALNQTQNSTSPIKYLLQNNIKFNQSRQGERGEQEVQLISKLLISCKIFQDLQINPEDSNLMKQLCKGVVLIYCESPHIMEINDNQLYIFLEGQGFEYMQSNSQIDYKKLKIYDNNNEYLMLRKMNSNDYFLSLQEYNARYHVNQKKYQLMVDEYTLLGKISDQTFQKTFHNKIIERQKNLVAFIKKVEIFAGLPNSFFLQFSKFLVSQQSKQGDKILTRQQKSKFVYLIADGEVQLRHFTEQKTKNSLQTATNYYVTNNKQYNIQKLCRYDSFGMQKFDMLDSLVDKEAVCLTNCTFQKIEKRLLAIIITSFDIEFQAKHKIWSQININSQIKGQNYITPQKQLLSRNVQRIRTTERKSRDLRLRLLLPNKKKEDEDLIKSIQRQKSKKQTIIDQKYQLANTNRVLSPEQKRRMIKTEQGRFRTASIFKFVNNFGGILQNKQDLVKNQSVFSTLVKQQSEKVMNQIQLTTLQEERVFSPVLRFSNTIEYKNRFQGNKFSRTFSQTEKHYNTSKFVPKFQPKASESVKQLKDRYNSDMIGVFLDKKIKNEIVKKAQKVMNLNKNLKMIENKNIKRLFSVKDYKAINAISQYDKKSIAQDIVQRMTNLRDNPLLLQIESERRKVERQMKLAQKHTKSSQVSPKKYKKQDELILIKNQD